MNTPDVEVGDRLGTEHATVRIHHSDMTFHVRLRDEKAILHINVIRVYELEGEAFLDPEALGILPFTALMKLPADMTAAAWVARRIQTTQQASVDKETRGTLLFALSLFGSLVHPPELFQNPISEAIMQESPFYQ